MSTTYRLGMNAGLYQGDVTSLFDESRILMSGAGDPRADGTYHQITPAEALALSGLGDWGWAFATSDNLRLYGFRTGEVYIYHYDGTTWIPIYGAPYSGGDPGILINPGWDTGTLPYPTMAWAYALTEVENVRDVTLTLEAGEADVTTRSADGWRATAPTLRECTVEFQMVWRPGDTVFEAIKTAFLTSGSVSLAVLDQKRTVTGAQGPLGDFSITNFSRNEALEEAIVADVTAKLSLFREWHVSPGGT